VALRMFLLPGSLIGGALGPREDDGRTMNRSLANMLAWNLAVMLAGVAA
jgi:hypothetical protein